MTKLMVAFRYYAIEPQNTRWQFWWLRKTHEEAACFCADKISRYSNATASPVVGIVTLGLDGPRFYSRQQHIYFSLRNVQTGCWPPSLIPNRYGGLFTTDIKLPPPCQFHLVPSLSEVKNEWIYTLTPPTRLHGVHRDNLTFPFTLTDMID
jgi:hypothetical protein